MNIERLVLGGERSAAADGKTFSVIEPGTGKPFAEVAQAGVADAEQAVQVAHRAFEDGAWPRMNATVRGRILLHASALVRQRLEAIATVEARHARKPLRGAGGEHSLGGAGFEKLWGAPE